MMLPLNDSAPVPARDDTIPVGEATTRFRRSRSWFFEQFRKGTLKPRKFRGDNKTRVLPADVARLLNTPR